MELKKYKLGELCEINQSTISSADNINSILYLDTSNLNQNEVGHLQQLLLSEAPSRAQRKVKHNTILYSSVRPNQKHYGILSQPKSNLIVSTGFITLDIKDDKKKAYRSEITGIDRKDVDKIFAELKKEGAIVSPVRCKWEPVQK